MNKMLANIVGVACVTLVSGFGLWESQERYYKHVHAKVYNERFDVYMRELHGSEDHHVTVLEAHTRATNDANKAASSSIDSLIRVV